MKAVWSALAVLAATAAPASAQVNLTGQYICVQLCYPGLDQQPAFITQNGWEMRLLNEAGQPSRAWVDYPGHIWADTWQTGAIFSPDGMTIQFDRGTIWQRFIPPPLFPPRRR
jgi:hypothetical protein